MSTLNDAFYFGCWEDAGHHLRNRNGWSMSEYSRDMPEDFPLRLGALDSGFLPPKRKQVQGEGYLIHMPGWTMLTFWDRTIDERSGSNSAFILRGRLTFEETVTIAKAIFPKIWSRFPFEVVEVVG